MKTKILEALKTKFAGVQDAVLNRIVEKLVKTVTKEEDVATAVEGVTFQQVIESYADSRATEATQSAVANYEKKHGLKDGKKNEGGEPVKPNEPAKATDDVDVPAWAKTIIESNKTLTEKLAAFENGKTADSRKTKLGKAIEKAPEKIRSRYEKDFGRMKFETDDDFDSWLTEVTTDVDAISHDFSQKGTVIKPPMGGKGAAGDETVSPIVKARADARKAEQVAPAITGLPTVK